MIEQEVGPLFEAIMIAQLKMYFLLDFFDPLTRSQYDQIQERVILALSEFWEKATTSDHINRFGEELLASNLQKMPSEMDLILFTNGGVWTDKYIAPEMGNPRNFITTDCTGYWSEPQRYFFAETFYNNP
eukprot:Awhi_evm3s14318